MKNQLLSGYIFGVIYGLLWAVFRAPPKHELTWLEQFFGSVIAVFTVFGLIGVIGAALFLVLPDYLRSRAARAKSRTATTLLQ